MKLGNNFACSLSKFWQFLNLWQNASEIPNFHEYLYATWLPFYLTVGDKLCCHFTIIAGFDLLIYKQFCHSNFEISMSNYNNAEIVCQNLSPMTLDIFKIMGFFSHLTISGIILSVVVVFKGILVKCQFQANRWEDSNPANPMVSRDLLLSKAR